ncbi:MAG: LEA type 2 family protein [Gammaproteobacteria bacterium]
MSDHTIPFAEHIDRRRLLQWLALGSATAVAACAGLPTNLIAPEVSVRNVTLGQLDLSGLDVMVDLRVKNPNNITLPVTGIEYGLVLQKIRVAEGRQARAVTLPALGETDMPLVVTVNLLKTATGLLPLLMNPAKAPKSLAYQVDGKVKLDWWYMPAIPFNRAGDVPLQFG